MLPKSACCVVLTLFCFSLYSPTNGKLGLGVYYQENSYCPELTEFTGEVIPVGCFNTFSGVFRPSPPEKINAIYSLYRYEDPSHRYRRWRYDESLGGERDDLFKPDDKLAVIIHGFTDNANRPWMPQMRDALFLQKEPEKLKVIIVDWHEGSEKGNYAAAARNVYMLGKTSAELVKRIMARWNLKEKNIHLIGHSLGGQTVGIMCTWLFTNYNIKIGRATGLDVASPLFAERFISPNKSHAHFFESVHTSSGDSLLRGKYGLQNAFSHLDIYPNGGTITQPGCVLPPTTVHCSHDLSRPFYSELLIICNKGCEFNVTNCDSALTANLKACTGPVSDICERMRYLADNATDDDNEIVYFETQEDELVSPCNKNWNTSLVKSMDDIVNLVKTGINPNVY